MTDQRKNLDYAKFFELCEWVKRQPQPITMSRLQFAAAYHADTGIHVSASAIKHAIKATKVEVAVSRSSLRTPKKIDMNRVPKIVGVLRRLVAKLEKDLGEPMLSEEDKNFLQLVANGTPKVIPKSAPRAE
jgi:hypothetical protein